MPETGEKAAEIWPDEPAKARQMDTDARGTVKFSKPKPGADGKKQIDIAMARRDRSAPPGCQSSRP